MDIIEQGPKMSNYEQGNIMGGFISTIDKNLLRSIEHLFFDQFLNVLNNTSKEFLEKYTDYMVPGYGNDDLTVSKIKELIPQIPEGHPAVLKSLKTNIDTFERVSRGKKLSQSVIDSLA